MSDLRALHKRIATLFSEKMNLDIPSIDTDLFETGVLDSLAFVNLVLHLEQAFGIKISLDALELDNFRSIQKIAAFVAEDHRAKWTSLELSVS